ncbi:hypothetical protein [Streptomyces cyaneofuscatus]|uniref:hypothetical protein n=1 Tax=Streptomyces cyaneofuscatus TaxID=66883 RepID=UPI0034476852
MSTMKKAHIFLVAVACALMTASCGGSDAPLDTSRLTDRETEWAEFSYAHEKNEDTKRTWEQLPAEGVKSYVGKQRLRLCGDTPAVMQNLKEAGYTADEMQEYKTKITDLLC